MIECIFTIDYEIYGNGEGSLKELVYEPTRKLKDTFDQTEAKIVVFVEAAELEKIEATESDSAINEVKRQVHELHKQGHEIALHLHPQWYNASYNDGKWDLDYSEYNICTLPRERIAHILDRSIAYLRSILGESDFTPVSFRAGNWLFQPTQIAATLLADRGIKVDSSVFKGGLQHYHKLDYRRSLKNGYYWRFVNDLNVPVPNGTLLELPIHTKMVPFWKMLTTKRIGMQQKGLSVKQNGKKNPYRLLDFLRFRYPLKLDFCRMTISELISMVETVIREDQKNPESFRPIVAIGHTKELVDIETVKAFLAFLCQKEIAVSTFEEVYKRCRC